jgi:copper chaperone NosL
MTLADDKFGAELVTAKGKIFKFDDIKCMINFIQSGEAQGNQYAFELVVDYGHKADEFDLIPAADAFYVRSSDLNSPMGGGIAAFKDQPEQQAFKNKTSGTTLSWSEVSKSFR